MFCALASVGDTLCHCQCAHHMQARTMHAKCGSQHVLRAWFHTVYLFPFICSLSPHTHTRHTHTNTNTHTHRLSPLNMPDYAEVAGCSTFKNAQSPLYDSFGAYATTNVVRNVNLFANPHYPTGKSNGIHSAPNAVADPTNGRPFLPASEPPYPLIVKANGKTAAMHKTMNIIENKMNAMNNLNRSTQSVQMTAAANAMDRQMAGIKSVPSTPLIGLNGTVRRTRLPKIGHCDKISFGGCDNGQSIEQPLFIKSKEDGSWTSVQNSAYQFAGQMSAASTASLKSAAISDRFKMNASNSSVNTVNNSVSCNNGGNNASATNQIHFSSFGRADNV